MGFESWWKRRWAKEAEFGDFYLDLDYDSFLKSTKEAFEAGRQSLKNELNEIRVGDWIEIHHETLEEY